MPAVNPPPARTHPYNQMPHQLRLSIQYNTGGIGTAANICIGTLPRNAIVTGGHVKVNTAFNAATTNVLNVGVAGTPAAISTGSITSTGFTTISVPGYKATADTPVFLQYTQSGTAATTGDADVILYYSVDNG